MHAARANFSALMEIAFQFIIGVISTTTVQTTVMKLDVVSHSNINAAALINKLNLNN